MAKYRNSAIEAEMAEDAAEQELVQELEVPATTVEEEQWKKRYSDLRRHQAAKDKEAQDREEALRKQLQAANTGSIRMPKSEEEVEAWSKQYPEFRSTLDAIISREVKEALRTAENKLAKLEEKSNEVTKREAFLELKKLHPDVEQLFKQNSDFHKWLSKQGKRHQDAIYTSLDIGDADFVITKFKLESQKNSNSKVEDESFNDAARAVRASGDSSMPESFGDYDFSESQIEKMSSGQYDANEEKIMTAIRKGRFLYDLTGGARM